MNTNLPKLEWFQETSFSSPHQNWLLIGNKRIEFQGRGVYSAQYAGDKYVIVDTGKFGHNYRDGGLDRNIFCFDLQGNIVWQIDTPRYADGRVLHRAYMTMKVLTPYGRILVECQRVFRPDDREGSRGGITYEVDLETGNIMVVHERQEIGGLLYSRGEDQREVKYEHPENWPPLQPVPPEPMLPGAWEIEK